MEQSIFIKDLDVNSEWAGFLTPGVIRLLTHIENQVSEGYTPPSDKVLRFLQLPLSQVRIVILGQDPYPQPGRATGRAFEVGGLKSWNEPFQNVSLKNIIRALYKAYTGRILTFNQIREKLDNEFPVLPPGRLFSHWEKQGVLLLNTSFTCKDGAPGSHQKVWEEYTKLLLEYINKANPEITWFLWGNHALKATGSVNLKNRIITRHPMMCYNTADNETDFLYGRINCFEAFIPEIDWTGYKLKPDSAQLHDLFQ